MLQQTQVKTVIPYWERWMRLFPDVSCVASAPIDNVLKAWEGLGYYSRARNIHRAAANIAERHGGRFPSSYDDILALPGIGRYTAGAICSIAYGEPTPILDGNVARVLARVQGISENIKTSPGQKRLWSASQSLVKAAEPLRVSRYSACSALNQGLMELGALICTPKNPSCTVCPVHRDCHAFRTGQLDRFPVLPSRPPTERALVFAFVLQRNGKVLVRKRPEKAVNGDLWEFPQFNVLSGKKHLAQAREFIGRELRSLRVQQTVKHTIMNTRISMRVFATQVREHGPQLSRRLASVWKAFEELPALPFSGAHAKIRKHLLDGKLSS